MRQIVVLLQRADINVRGQIPWHGSGPILVLKDVSIVGSVNVIDDFGMRIVDESMGFNYIANYLDLYWERLITSQQVDPKGNLGSFG